MNPSELQIQGIKIEDTDMDRVAAEVEVLQAIDSESSLLDPYGKPVENLYEVKISTEEGLIWATLYITDDPEADLREKKEDLESMANERKNLLSNSTQRDDLVRAIALQYRMLEFGKSIKFKEQLLNISNPVLEEDNSTITASLI